MRGILLLLVLLATSVPLAAQVTTLRGLVKDYDQRPLAGALVQLVDQAGQVLAESTSSSTGQYELVNVPAGTHVLQVFMEGHEAVRLPSVWLAKDKLTLMDVALRRLDDKRVHPKKKPR
jgi:hypothetical protein